MFPWVLSPKTRNPAKAIARHASMEAKVEKWVTRANLSIVGFFKDPYINNELWSSKCQHNPAGEVPEFSRQTKALG